MEKSYLISELADQAEVAENTARRYARLFEEFFSPRQYGRARKYPPEAAATLRRISDFYRQGLTTPEIFERLHAQTASDLSREVEGVCEAAKENVRPETLEPMVREVLARLRAQDGLRQEYKLIKNTLAILWQEYKRWRAQPGSIQEVSGELITARRETAELREKMAALAEDNETLRRELASLRSDLAREEAVDALRGELETIAKDLELRFAKRLDEVAEAMGPAQQFLCLPLVFRSEKNEFLGVSDKDRKHFTLKDFLRLIEQKGRAGRAIAMSWQHRPKKSWRLTITENSGQGPKEKAHTLDLSRTRTPRGNVVVVIDKLVFDGRDMPVFFLYELFKQIGREFA